MRSIIILSLFSITLLLQSCSSTEIPRFHYRSAGEAIKKYDSGKAGAPVLKAHLKDGGLLILENLLEIDTIAGFVKGKGVYYDYNRTPIKEGEIKVNTDSVLIYEINEDLELRDGLMVLAPLAIVNVSVTLACLVNPKACFGSCPTFYSEEGLPVFGSRGEGFSNAIAPSLEYGDVDDLRLPLQNGDFNLIMKNEAQETHCLREVQLWAFPVASNEEVYMTREKEFFSSTNSYELSNASQAEESITDLLNRSDGKEYFSQTDADNIAGKEELILEFDSAELAGDLALLLEFRQTLMTTYFIYSAMAYMGDEVSDIFAKIEKEKDLYEKLDNGLKSELGELEVHLWDTESETWIYQSSLYETGPIAINRQIVPLKHKGQKVRIKLLMNKGLWRIDYAALVGLDKKLNPQKLSPSSLKKNGGYNYHALSQLNDSEKLLVSLPGDHFELHYDLPEANQGYRLHLYSKGYYMEWMRKEWLGDKNLYKLNQMMNHPKRYLKKEAGSYKEYESVMEEVFWSSQVKSKISSNED